MKKMVLIGLAIFLAGGILFTVALGISDWDIRRMSTMGEFEQKEQSFSGITSIFLDDKDMKVKLMPSQDDKVHISYYDNEKEWYEITGGDTLRVVKEIDRKWFNYVFNMDFSSREFVLFVPESFAGEITVNTSNGKVSAENITADNLEINTSNAGVFLKKVTVSKNIDINSSNGKLNAEKVTAGGSLTASSSNAAIEYDQVVSGSINLKSSNGKMEFYELKATDKIIAATSNAHILLKNVDVGVRGDFESSNGKIRGNILGKMSDFSITSKTSNGDNNLPKKTSGGDKTLKVRTSNSSINILFDD